MTTLDYFLWAFVLSVPVGGLLFCLGWAIREARRGEWAPAQLLGTILFVVLWAISLVALLERALA